MPLYDYKADDDFGCEHCQQGFTARQHVNEPPIPFCPRCGASVSRRIGSFYTATPRIGKQLNEQRAKRAGFKILRKNGDGGYEVT
ncbi:MAG: zinc ribbon domain-containing protein [Fimbriimonadaceae bacterium]|nr:zinc ribbon domain-containing protein [Fimbriimonadaceae bacterium]